MINKVHWY